MYSRIMLAISAIFLGMQLNAQVELSGTVSDQRGDELPGAHVSLKGTYMGTTTDETGSFELGNVKEGSYTVEVSFIGYEKYTASVELLQNIKMSITLEESSIMADEVIVKANRANVNDPVAYTNISREQIEKSDRTRDIPYLLQLTPSVVTSSDPGTGIGYSGLRIRGTDPSRINVTLNGIPYNDSESHDVYWVNIPDFVSSVENIQVQRGVGTSTQGAAAFGANINFQTSSVSKEPYARLQSSAGSFNTLKNSVSAGTGLINDHISVDMRLSQINSDGYIDRAFAKLKSYYLAAGWYGSKSILKATTFAGKELTYQAWGGVPAEMLESDRTYNPYTYENEVDDYQQSHYQLHWSYQASRTLNLNAALHYTRGGGFYEQFREGDDLSAYLLDPVILGDEVIEESDIIRRKWLDNDFYGGIFNLNYSKGKVHLSGGAGWNRYDGDHFGRVIWSQFASNGNINHQYYFSNGLKTEWNSFAKVNYQLLSGLNLFTDVQFRHIDYLIDGRDDDQRDITQDHEYNFINPKAGVSLDLAGNNQVYFSYSVANREPKRSNFTDSRPGEEVKPEKLNDFELGHTYKSAKVSIGINAYYMDYKDQLVLTGEINDVGSAIMINVPDSYRAGLEFMVAYKPFSNLKWEANATFSRNRIKGFVEYVDDWDTWGQNTEEYQNTSLSFSPGLIAGSSVVYTPVSGLDLSLLSKYVGKQYIDNTSSEQRKLDPYFINSLSLSYTLNPPYIKEMSVFFNVINLFDEMYESNAWVYSYYLGGERNEMIGYYPQAGRHFMLGLLLDL